MPIHRKRILQLGAILLWALFAAPAPQAAAAGDMETFRQDTAAVLDQMMDVIETLQTNPIAAEALAGSGSDPLALLIEAQQVLAIATDEELAPLQIALDGFPEWRSWPGQLSPIADKFAVAASASEGPAELVPDVCSVAIFLDITVTDRAIAEGLSLAAEVVMELLPTDGLTILARAIPVGLWAAAEGLAITATANNDVKENCNGDDALAAIQSSVDGVQTSVDTVQSSVDTAQTSLDAAHVKLDALQVSVDAANAKLDALKASNEAMFNDIIRLLHTPQGQRASDFLACAGEACDWPNR